MSFAAVPNPEARRTPSPIGAGAPGKPGHGAGPRGMLVPARVRVQPSRRGSRRRLLGALLLAALGMAALGLRTHIVRAVSVAAAVYEAVGLPVNLAGLSLRNVRARIVPDGNRRVLVTEGEIVNIRREENHSPALALTVRGDNGLPRYAWTVPAPKARLGAGEAVTFRARLAAPPEDGVEVVVRFSSAEALPVGRPDVGELRLASRDRGDRERPSSPADIPNPGKMP